MRKILYPAGERGTANHGWLIAKHSFSFANYHNPAMLNFGALRVLNDDIVAPGMGFGTHPHDNMEIITIPLKGALEHKDSMGNSSVIYSGEIQVMSAGSGVTHSEFNPSRTDEVNLFQIWIFPNKRNVEPRYDQFKMNAKGMHNCFLQLISPNFEEEGTWIYQDAWIHITYMDRETILIYELKKSGNGVYVMLIDGEIQIDSDVLKSRDAFGIVDTSSIEIKAIQNSKLLVIEVPMVV